MAKFAYNNVNNASTGYIPFKFNYGYYLRILFKKNINPHLKSYSIDKLAEKLSKLIEICCQNLLYAQKL